MSIVISPTSKMLTLVKRECQEQRILFLYLPLLITLMVAAAIAVAAVRAYSFDFSFIGLIAARPEFQDPLPPGERLQVFSMLSMEMKAGFWNQYYGQTIPLVFISFWAAMFYYFQMTLYSQRKDRSILFWNSMPVSNVETVVSKVLAGFCVAFVVYMLNVLILQLLNLLILVLYGAMYNVPLWDTFIAPSGILSRFARMFGAAFIGLFWCLPVYAWFLLISAWSRSAPFAWAMAPVALVTMGELVMFGTADTLGLFMEHLLPFGIFELNPESPNYIFIRFGSIELLISVLLGIALLYGAVLLNRSEDG